MMFAEMINYSIIFVFFPEKIEFFSILLKGAEENVLFFRFQQFYKLMTKNNQFGHQPPFRQNMPCAFVLDKELQRLNSIGHLAKKI
jgi:hypothetical protein